MKTNKLRWLCAAAAIALASHVTGCSDDADQAVQDVTDIDNSSVKRQSIGNCWIYASVGWVESLRLTHAGEELNLSESYLTYWHWFEQIADGAPGERALADMDDKEDEPEGEGDPVKYKEIGTGGWWAVAVELMRRYGMLDEGVFIPEEAEEARSSRQSSALSAINKSLKEGALSTAEARRDIALVRDELDAAWKLKPEVVALLDEVFGAAVEQTLYDSPPIPAESGLRTVQGLAVGHSDSELSLADAIGEPAYTWWGIYQRKGTYAWNSTRYPSSASARRSFQIKVQDAMHRRLPAIISWFVDFNALENDNTFRNVPDKPGRQGGHMTVVEDYEIENVPGYGVLPAGELVTDPAKLEAALSPEATIRFFRIKNSWGSSLSPDPGQGDELKGYYDLWMSYLDAEIPNKDEDGTSTGLSSAVLPPDTFQSGGGEPEEPSDPDPVTGCAHELCETGEALDPECDPCVALIGEVDPFCIDNAWDDICVEQVTSVCEIDCSTPE